MILEVLPVGPLQCNCSILGDETTGEGIVVDPGDEIDRILAIVAKHKLTVKQIIVTHAHFDHIAGAAKLKAATGAPVYYNQLDLPLLKLMDEQADWLGMRRSAVTAPDVSAEDGTKIEVGGLSGVVLHTPGHTEGSISLHFPGEGLLLAGDTLFAGSIGRTDLPGGDFKKIMASLRERIAILPEETKVVAGHGPATTIAVECESNPFLQDK
jgi:glyoxylase-like metal-dependent hydrolase (beta-lactamase superfamily II)